MQIENRGAVVIPAFGKDALTRTVVADALRESALVKVIVVDNAGDLEMDDSQHVTVLRPGSNLGWLRGTNHGLEWALAREHAWVVGLNNDTRLSIGFFQGLRRSLEAHPNALVVPCFDDLNWNQNAFYTGRLDEFAPEPTEFDALPIDGTCFALNSKMWRQLGRLDEKNFGRRGWGGIEDLSVRALRAGGRVMVTRRSYLTHERASTAHTVSATYEKYALAEMHRGLRRKYGHDWPSVVGLDSSHAGTRRDRLSQFFRTVEQRLGLTETWIGKR